MRAGVLVSVAVKLMVDVNTVWDLKTALVWGRRLEEFDVAWLEEPMHPFDVRAHAELRRDELGHPEDERRALKRRNARARAARAGL